jgi:uncharacterized membrane protein required for colicin V production
VHFNQLDLIIGLIILFSIIGGLQKGFIDALGGIIGIVLALFLGVVYYDECANWLEQAFGITTNLARLIEAKIPAAAVKVNSKIMESFGAAAGYTNPGEYLAYLLTLVISFVFILLVGNILIKLLFSLAHHVLARGALEWVNRVLGAGLVAAKNLLITAVILGITLPVIQTGREMGLDSAIYVYNLINKSFLAPQLILAFDTVKNFIILNV